MAHQKWGRSVAGLKPNQPKTVKSSSHPIPSTESTLWNQHVPTYQTTSINHLTDTCGIPHKAIACTPVLKQLNKILVESFVFQRKLSLSHPFPKSRCRSLALTQASTPGWIWLWSHFAGLMLPISFVDFSHWRLGGNPFLCSIKLVRYTDIAS